MFTIQSTFIAIFVLLLAGPIFQVQASAAQEAKYSPAGKKLIAASTAKSGKFRLKNVGTGQYLTYKMTNSQFYPGSTASYVTLQGKGAHYTILHPSESNKKCASAQWDYTWEGGVDWATALYKCVVGNFKRSLSDWADHIYEEDEEIVSPEEATYVEFSDDGELIFDPEDTHVLDKRESIGSQGPVRPAKQYFLFTHATTKHAYNILASDHILDMPTRAVTGDCYHKARANGVSKYACLNVFSKRNKKQQWYLIRSNGTKLRRRFLTDKTLGRWH